MLVSNLKVTSKICIYTVECGADKSQQGPAAGRMIYKATHSQLFSVGEGVHYCNL